MVIVEGREAIVKDVDGNEHIDFSASSVCASVGYNNHPEVIEAVIAQARNFLWLKIRFHAPQV